MKQVFFRDGRAVIEDVPSPALREGEVLVRVVRSCFSTGGAVAGETAQNTPACISGYSAAGVVLKTGEGIHDIFHGDRVAFAAAQHAHHAGIISVPRNHLVPIPDKLSFDEAASVAFGAVALQGVRRVIPTLGESFVVIGLRLIGQLTAQLLKANGCRVIGGDLVEKRIQIAEELGMDFGILPGKGDCKEAVERITGGLGADGVIITASEPEAIIAEAFQMCRKKGRVALVGDVEIDINRADIYRKELDFYISTSYGPGPYNSEYEGKNVDYPIGYVRWTENRNMEEYLNLIAEGKIKVRPLIEETYPVEKAAEAYKKLKNTAVTPVMTLLSYPDDEIPERKLINPAVSPVTAGQLRVAVAGAGGFAKTVHLPNIKRHSDLYSLHAVLSRNAENAEATAGEFGARYSTTDFKQIIDDHEIDAVFITTRHNLHAGLTLEALKAGKHVFVENPLAVNAEELETIRNFFASSGGDSMPLLMTGFNRRFSPFVRRIRKLTENRANPMVLNYRMNAGCIPLDHWLYTVEGGGRNIGEACNIYDLFTYLTDAGFRTVDAVSIRPSGNLCSNRDNFVATITFTDGSVAALTYTALGSTEYPKEKLEVYCDKRVFVIDDFSGLTGYGIQDINMRSDCNKGHVGEIKAFAEAVLEDGSWPIPLWQQCQAMEIAFEVEKILSR